MCLRARTLSTLLTSSLGPTYCRQRRCRPRCIVAVVLGPSGVCNRAHTRFSSLTKSSGPALRHQRRCLPSLTSSTLPTSSSGPIYGHQRRCLPLQIDVVVLAFGPGLSPPCLVGLCGPVPCCMSMISDNTSSSPWSSSPSLSRRQSRYVFEQTFFLFVLHVR